MYPELVTVKDSKSTDTFESAFLCKFMLFRKVFFQSFDEELDSKNFPSEMNLKEICDSIDVST